MIDYNGTYFWDNFMRNNLDSQIEHDLRLFACECAEHILYASPTPSEYKELKESIELSRKNLLGPSNFSLYRVKIATRHAVVNAGGYAVWYVDRISRISHADFDTICDAAEATEKRWQEDKLREILIRYS